MTCTVKDCTRPIRTGEYCNAHYQKWLKYGDPTVSKRGLTAEQKWRRAVDVGEPWQCWTWTRYVKPDGYARFTVYADGSPTTVYAHRWAYEHFVGPIPEGMQLDHLCRVRHCCNPAHLEPVTPQVNTLRGEGPTAEAAKRTHCKRGHPLSGDNLHVVMPKGERRCRTCSRMRQRKYRKASA